MVVVVFWGARQLSVGIQLYIVALSVNFNKVFNCNKAIKEMKLIYEVILFLTLCVSLSSIFFCLRGRMRDSP